MRRGVWLGALALVGAVQANGVAQTLVWKRTEQPSRPVPTVRASSANTSGVILDRPILSVSAESPGPGSPPSTFPAEYRQGLGSAGSSPRPQVDAIPISPSPGTIIASSSHAPVAVPAAMVAPEPDEGERMGDQFAAERPSRSGVRQASTELAESAPLGNWLKTYPVTPPQPTGVIPSDATVISESPAVPRFYARAEYLLWWTKNDHTPPLVTTGSTTAQAGNRFDGAIGNPDTVVLFGGTLSRNPFSGGLFTVGYALDECGDKFVELNGFFLGPKSNNFSASSAQYPLLTRPFFAVNSNIQQEVVEVVTRPGAVVGNIAVHAPSQLWGLEPNVICKCLEGCNYRIDYLVGGRYLNLRESVTVTETFMAQPVPLPIFDGQQVVISDRFATTNQFFGGQVGVQGTWFYDRFSLQGQAKLAAGITHEKSSVRASFNFPGNVDPRPGGLLALGSNIGDISRNRFAVVPELGARLGYNVTDSLRLTVGYRFIYWSSVVRPGDQIDRNLDVTQIPNFQIPPGTNPVTPARPAPLFKETDYWAQGLTFGVEFRY